MTAALSATAACSSKPDTALCGRYYRHTLSIQERDGQPGALAGLKTEGAKRAVLNHCMQLSRAQVDCVLGSASTLDATACERGAFALPEEGLPEFEDRQAPDGPESTEIFSDADAPNEAL